MKKRVAIVGGGIGGLTALHELSKYPSAVEAHLFEAENRVGGRIRTVQTDGHNIDMGACYFHRYYDGFLHLVDELGYTERIVPYESGRSGFLLDGKTVGLDTKGILGGLFTTRLTLDDVVSLQRLKKGNKTIVEEGNQALKAYAADSSINFMDVVGHFPTLQAGYCQPFSDFTSSLTPTVREKFIRPLLLNTLFTSPEMVNATVGKSLFVDRHILQTFEGGLETLSEGLYERHKESISLESPVLSVVKLPRGYGMMTSDGRGINEYDAVISAVPLSRLPSIFPSFTSPVDYAGIRKILIRGSPKKNIDGFDSIYIGEGDSGIHSISRKGEHLYKVSTKGNDPRIDDFFTSYDVVNDVSWKEAVPLIGHQTSIPSPLTEDKGFYLVGDYALPCMELSVATGYKAARHILKE